MDKQHLINSAQLIEQVSPDTLAVYARMTDSLVARQTIKMLQRNDIKELIGESNESILRDNIANHCRFMSSLFVNYNPEVFVETVLWVFRAYGSRGFTQNYFASQLNSWMEHLREDLDAEVFAEIYPYYNWMQVNIPIFVLLTKD